MVNDDINNNEICHPPSPNISPLNGTDREKKEEKSGETHGPTISSLNLADKDKKEEISVEIHGPNMSPLHRADREKDKKSVETHGKEKKEEKSDDVHGKQKKEETSDVIHGKQLPDHFIEAISNIEKTLINAMTEQQSSMNKVVKDTYLKEIEML